MDPSPARSTDVLVVGGGIAGIAAANELARRGIRILLVERETALGGRAALLACMATERCRLCGACLLGDAVAELRRHGGIEVRTGATVSSARRAGQGIEMEIEGSGKKEHWNVRGAILATGFDVYDAALKPFLGHGRLDGVVTTLELDGILRESGDVGWAREGRAPASVAFVQCVGSRESREGRGYCSQVCCSVALRLAGKLLHLHPGIDVTIFYIDLQLAARNVGAYRAELRDRIRFIQGVPGEIVGSPDGRLEVRHEDTGRGTSSTFDRVVLSVGMVPSRSTSALASMLGVEVGPYGFLEPGEPPVLAAGAGTFPKDIPGSMNEAREAAARIALALARTRDVGEAAHVR